MRRLVKCALHLFTHWYVKTSKQLPSELAGSEQINNGSMNATGLNPDILRLMCKNKKTGIINQFTSFTNNTHNRVYQRLADNYVREIWFNELMTVLEMGRSNVFDSSSSSSKYTGRRTNHPLCPDRRLEAELFFVVELYGLVFPEVVQKLQKLWHWELLRLHLIKSSMV